jgi:ketosteroid isomerase-like protein
MKAMKIVALAAGVLLASQSSQAQTAKGLPAAEVKKIVESTEAFAKAMLAKDWTAVSALYTEDGSFNPPNEVAISGRAALKGWLTHLPPVTEFNFTNVKVEGRDDLAYVLGNYAMTLQVPGATAPVKDAGKYVEIRRRQPDGRWLISVDIFNSDLPAPR